MKQENQALKEALQTRYLAKAALDKLPKEIIDKIDEAS